MTDPADRLDELDEILAATQGVPGREDDYWAAWTEMQMLNPLPSDVARTVLDCAEERKRR